MKNRFNIAVIAGDGIGKEVMPEGIKVLKKVSEKFNINLNFEEFDFSSYDYYEIFISFNFLWFIINFRILISWFQSM